MLKSVLVAVLASLIIAPSIGNKTKCYQNRLYNRFNCANVRLMGNFLKQQLDEHPYTTFATSSFIPLLQGGALALNSCGDTYDEILQLINLDSREQIKKVLKYAMDIITSNGDVKSRLECLLAADDGITFRKPFKRRIRDLINCKTDYIDTCDRDDSAQTLNQWVKDQDPDHGNEDVISACEIHSDPNGLYFFGFHKFEADWGSPFNPQGMTNISFHVNNEIAITLPALVGNGLLRYSDNKDFDCQMVEFPQKGHEYGILVLLTNSVTALPSLIDKINQNPELLIKAYNEMEKTHVNATILLGEVHDTVDIKKNMVQANYTKLFDPKTADFKDISTRNNKHIYIAESRHTFSIIGNAQAGQNWTSSGSSSDESPGQEIKTKVICDHPFLYIVTGECATFLTAGLYFGNT